MSYGKIATHVVSRPKGYGKVATHVASRPKGFDILATLCNFPADPCGTKSPLVGYDAILCCVISYKVFFLY
ncbi:MAG: hypothetical protein LBG31_06315 [Prevotellaceae bacterium]|nr:hypothetical protein [Prevotellaceae bacterium]